MHANSGFSVQNTSASLVKYIYKCVRSNPPKLRSLLVLKQDLNPKKQTIPRPEPNPQVDLNAMKNLVQTLNQ